MSTAVADVPPAAAYGFPGSAKRGKPEEVVVLMGKRRSEGFFIEEEEEEVLTESSSIGAPSPASSSIGENSGEEEGGDEEEEVESKLKEEDEQVLGLGCLDALEESLPIKRGLSNFYPGKSKSFTSLAEATASPAAAANELAKPENPFNKRRRILATWSRRASCSSLATATYLPPLLAPDHAVAEGDEGEEDDSDDDERQHRGKNGGRRESTAPPLPPPRLTLHTQMGGMVRRNGTFRSPRSLSLWCPVLGRTRVFIHKKSIRDLLLLRTGTVRIAESCWWWWCTAMSTAVADVPPAAAYGFPGSAKRGKPEEVVVLMGKRRSEGFFIEEEEEEVLTESSSIGAPSPASSSIGENSGEEEGGDEEEEVESKLKEEDEQVLGLGCLDALEESLPIKRGLSNFYPGKSKSFTSLAEATASPAAAANELAKPENPFNKRRRILATWSRRASCSSLATATYLPPLLAPDHAVAEGDEGEEDDSDDDERQHRGKNGGRRESTAPPLPPPRLTLHTQMGGMVRRNGTFRSPRSLSLSDLQNSGGSC
uniref:Uncharacterized protein n=1 Tax=Oryza meridionalis TaxID=40149 RepID=A0A0E0E8J3_9ORYZ